MKLLRWAVAGASVYAVYKYSIGGKAKGEDVLVSQDKAIAELTGDDAPAGATTTTKSASPARKASRSRASKHTPKN